MSILKLYILPGRFFGVCHFRITTMVEVQLWVRPEVMELGVLPILPPDKVSLEMLSRLLQYAHDLGERGFPQMNYDTWKHIAVKKVDVW
ncbi:TBCC domain-containing protein 1 [Portunus trituberculatus]|uniref:TBCC domain-containing protein 1 n=1 Tax=Portunus trituberculatus TaxID=210409 RepID=A0A5B7HUI1_PORTR|nr:TBCC domain-containing protein 1 [Portunus trituberculatus]